MNANQRLIAVAQPIMETLYDTLQGQKTIMMLTDAGGYILKVVGRQEIAEQLADFHMEEGGRWLEQDVGTNGVSLCLEYDRTMQVRFQEHYCQTHHIGVCTGTPIHDERGKQIGALVLVSQDYNAQTKSVSVAGAALIERQIALLRSKDTVEYIVNAMKEGVLLTDGEFRITKINPSAQRILGVDVDDYLGRDAQELIAEDTRQKIRPNQDFYFDILAEKRQISCVGVFTPIFFGDSREGAMLVFNEEKRMATIANTMAGNRATYHFRDIITQNAQIKAVIEECRSIAPTDCAVLLTGESGTGKELFAQSIHNESRRKNGPFIALNCAALPRELVESELFGYEGGAFTGAKKDGQPGKFELANGGTLFLDEVGELPLEIQSKLLRVLDNHRITRIGGKTEKTVDVRIIAATNRSLEDEVRKNNFRLDLLYRINVFTAKVTPLRQRRDDIALLTGYFLSKLNRNSGKVIDGATPEFYSILEQCQWEGNVRQLQNVIARAYYLCDGRILEAGHLPPDILLKNGHLPLEAEREEARPVAASRQLLLDAEKEMLVRAIKDANGNISKAAKLLGMGRTTLYRKIHQHQIAT